jgi:hypothetical protein
MFALKEQYVDQGSCVAFLALSKPYLIFESMMQLLVDDQLQLRLVVVFKRHFSF